MQIRKIVTATIVVLSLGQALADERLIGRWSSVDANNGALKGSMSFQKNGTAVLAAEGQPELTGNWAAPKPGGLAITMGDYGTAKIDYRFDKDRLVLTYDNGNEQTFAKANATSKSNPSQIKKPVDKKASQ